MWGSVGYIVQWGSTTWAGYESLAKDRPTDPTRAPMVLICRGMEVAQKVVLVILRVVWPVSDTINIILFVIRREINVVQVEQLYSMGVTTHKWTDEWNGHTV